MPRPPKWNSPTTSVRLPEHTIAACLELAKALGMAMDALRLELPSWISMFSQKSIPNQGRGQAYLAKAERVVCLLEQIESELSEEG
jgi:hypothetical protein